MARGPTLGGPHLEDVLDAADSRRVTSDSAPDGLLQVPNSTCRVRVDLPETRHSSAHDVGECSRVEGGNSVSPGEADPRGTRETLHKVQRPELALWEEGTGVRVCV